MSDRKDESYQGDPEHITTVVEGGDGSDVQVRFYDEGELVEHQTYIDALILTARDFVKNNDPETPIVDGDSFFIEILQDLGKMGIGVEREGTTPRIVFDVPEIAGQVVGALEVEASNLTPGRYRVRTYPKGGDPFKATWQDIDRVGVKVVHPKKPDGTMDSSFSGYTYYDFR